jgi:hypothetical protein
MPDLIEGRSCGTCTMCCKVFPLPSVHNKTAGVWCRDCKPGQGCGVWNTRPDVCSAFYCNYFFDATMSDEWRPDRAKFVITQEAGGIWLSIVTDAQNTTAWKREPYGSRLRAVAAQRMAQNLGLLWITPTQKFVVTPDEEVLLGPRDTDMKVKFNMTIVAGKREYTVERTA